MPDREISVTERAVKTVIRKGSLPETWFGARFTAAPYMACEHGCLYCDGRAEKYWVEGRFDKDIVVRSNFDEVFRRELRGLRERATVSFGSGITDPYQPVEAEYRLMRRAAEALAESKMPAAVLTKSALIRRDVDVWARVAEHTGMNLLMSITTVDDAVRSVFEPGASSMDERFDTLAQFKDAGCGIAILAMPFLPGISDTDESISALMERAQEIGADFVLPGGLTLRPGRQKEIFMQIIDSAYPRLTPLYKDLYKEQRQSGSPLASYQNALRARIQNIINTHQLSVRAPQRIYRSMFPLYDEVYMLLDHMVELYSFRELTDEEALARLKQGLGNYRDWLVSRKKAFNRKRSETQDDLEAELLMSAQTGELDSIIGNPRLSDLIKRVVIDRKVFDYQTLTFAE